MSDYRKEVFTIGHVENTNVSTIGKRTYTVMEIMEILDVSRKKAYQLCNSDNFKVVRVGKSIRVSKSSFDEWLDANNKIEEE
jgi:excisionase family DNA binding protein